ncbi:MAG: permease [Deltaproteobacteria bacterium]|nr:permease [Deltaproteobacteria bacterium]
MMPEILISVFVESFTLFAMMAPYLLLGVVAAGAMHVLLPVDFVSKRLGQKSVGVVFKAGALGVPIPLCSCGVVPVAASLRNNGASKGATVSFLVTTPTSGVDSMFATWSLLGWPLMVLRVSASFILGIVAGVLTNFADHDAAAPVPVKQERARTDKVSPVTSAIRYAFTELYEGISRPLLVGTLLGGIITALMPADLLSQTVGTGALSYLVMLVVGIPLYVCASGSIPLAAALLAKGISPGAALIFLIAGPATNAATVTIISNMLGKKTLLIYLAVLTLGTLGMGVATDWVFTAAQFSSPVIEHAHEHGEVAFDWYEIVSATGLLALSFYYLLQPIVRKLKTRKGTNMIELTVNDMTCGHCAKNVENAVCQLDGVKSVTANPDNKKVLIDADETQLSALKEAITKAGYTPQ